MELILTNIAHELADEQVQHCDSDAEVEPTRGALHVSSSHNYTSSDAASFGVSAHCETVSADQKDASATTATGQGHPHTLNSGIRCPRDMHEIDSENAHNSMNRELQDELRDSNERVLSVKGHESDDGGFVDHHELHCIGMKHETNVLMQEIPSIQNEIHVEAKSLAHGILEPFVEPCRMEKEHEDTHSNNLEDRLRQVEAKLQESLGENLRLKAQAMELRMHAAACQQEAKDAKETMVDLQTQLEVTMMSSFERQIKERLASETRAREHRRKERKDRARELTPDDEKKSLQEKFDARIKEVARGMDQGSGRQPRVPLHQGNDENGACHELGTVGEELDRSPQQCLRNEEAPLENIEEQHPSRRKLIMVEPKDGQTVELLGRVKHSSSFTHMQELDAEDLLQRRISALEEERVDLAHRLVKHEEKCASLEKDVASMTSEKENLRLHALEALRVQENLEENLEVVTRELVTKTVQLVSLELTTRTQCEKIADLEGKHRDVLNQSQEASNELEDTSMELADALEIQKLLRRELKQSRERIASLENEKSSVLSENEKLKAKLVSLDIKYTEEQVAISVTTEKEKSETNGCGVENVEQRVSSSEGGEVAPSRHTEGEEATSPSMIQHSDVGAHTNPSLSASVESSSEVDSVIDVSSETVGFGDGETIGDITKRDSICESKELMSPTSVDRPGFEDKVDCGEICLAEAGGVNPDDGCSISTVAPPETVISATFSESSSEIAPIRLQQPKFSTAFFRGGSSGSSSDDSSSTSSLSSKLESSVFETQRLAGEAIANVSRGDGFGESNELISAVSKDRPSFEEKADTADMDIRASLGDQYSISSFAPPEVVIYSPTSDSSSEIAPIRVQQPKFSAAFFRGGSSISSSDNSASSSSLSSKLETTILEEEKATVSYEDSATSASSLFALRSDVIDSRGSTTQASSPSGSGTDLGMISDDGGDNTSSSVNHQDMDLTSGHGSRTVPMQLETSIEIRQAAVKILENMDAKPIQVGSDRWEIPSRIELRPTALVAKSDASTHDEGSVFEENSFESYAESFPPASNVERSNESLCGKCRIRTTANEDPKACQEAEVSVYAIEQIHSSLEEQLGLDEETTREKLAAKVIQLESKVLLLENQLRSQLPDGVELTTVILEEGSALLGSLRDTKIRSETQLERRDGLATEAHEYNGESRNGCADLSRILPEAVKTDILGTSQDVLTSSRNQESDKPSLSERNGSNVSMSYYPGYTVALEDTGAQVKAWSVASDGSKGHDPEEMIRLRCLCDDKETELRACVLECERYVERIESAAVQMNELEQQIEFLEREKQELKRDGQRRFDSACAQLNELETQVNELEKEAVRREQERDSLIVEVEMQQKRLGSALTQLNEMENALMISQEDLAAAEFRVDVLEEQVRNLSNEQ